MIVIFEEGFQKHRKRQDSLFDVRSWAFNVRRSLVWLLAPFEGASSNHPLSGWSVITMISGRLSANIVSADQHGY
jgi:hypothetical protein